MPSCVLLQIHMCVQDTAVLNVVNLTAVKIIAPVKRLQTKTQVKVYEFGHKSIDQLTCSMNCFSSIFYWFVLCILCYCIIKAAECILKLMARF